MIPLSDIFDIEYPKTLVLTDQKLDANGTIFVSSKGTDNGISARVAEIPGRKKYKAGAITVALKGSVMSAFLQVEDFYIAHQTAVMYPKVKMTDEEKLFYCACLTANKYRFNYGRQADRTLKNMLVPAEIPKGLKSIIIDNVPVIDKSPIIDSVINLHSDNWEPFELQTMFDIKKGKRLTKENMDEGTTPFIAAIDSNNGWRDFIDQKPIHAGGTITVNYNGSVGEAFYQPLPFCASDDVNVLYPKFDMSVHTALFIATIIKLEKYRFNYGRKWHKERMDKSAINLPAKNGKPDFSFMENYIKSLPYSRDLTSTNLVIAERPKPIKRPQVEKGLSDEELVRKYESGGIDFGKTLKTALQNPQK